MDRHAKLREQWQTSDWNDVACFIGPNAEAFRPTWEKLRDKALAGRPSIVWGWSWPAFLLSFAWWAYRRQWLMVAVLIGVPLLIGFLLPTSSSAGAGVAIVIAMIAKSSYVQIAVARIARIRANGGGPDAIAAAGGVSMTAGAIAGVVYALAVALALAAILSSRP